MHMIVNINLIWVYCNLFLSVINIFFSLSSQILLNIIFISRYSSHFGDVELVVIQGGSWWCSIWFVMTSIATSPIHDMCWWHVAVIIVWMHHSMWRHIWWVWMLESTTHTHIHAHVHTARTVMMMHHLVNSIVVLWVLLILLGFLIACLALILGIFLSIRVPPVTRDTDEISAIIVVISRACNSTCTTVLLLIGVILIQIQSLDTACLVIGSH